MSDAKVAETFCGMTTIIGNWLDKYIAVYRAAKAYRDLKTVPEPDTEKLMYAFSSLDEALKAVEEGE